MQPLDETSFDSPTTSLGNSQENRKIREQVPRSACPRIPESSSSLPRPTPATTNSGTRPSKRLKLSATSKSPERPLNMSQTMGLVPERKIIDLTRPSNFQPHSGAKRLIVKNFRPTPPKDVDDFYNRVWDELDGALSSIFNETDVKTPLEVLCRGVEVTCRKGRAAALYEHLKDRCKRYLEKALLSVIDKELAPGSLEALRTVLKFWIIWNKQSTLIRSVFSYLDRSYLLNSKDLPQLEDMGIQQFRHAVFGKSSNSSRNRIGTSAISGICDLVEFDRTGHDRRDPTLLKDSIAMIHIFGIYGKSFEPEFLDKSIKFFNIFVQNRSNSSMKDYISACDELLYRESLRCDQYNFDGTTKMRLLASAHSILIEQCVSILVDQEGLGKLLDENAIASLKALYALLGLSKMQQQLKEPLGKHIKKVGSSIVSDKDRIDQMVIRLLELKRSLDIIIRDAFDKDESFSYCLRDAFGNFINDRKNTSAWGTNNSKVGEMIAKYLDILLRGGLKAVPRSLAFDSKDRDAAEREGQACTGDEDAELDRQLEQGLELFRFIEGKDVFEAFYKKDLARRLLMARSASQDAERSMLAKLKIECGHSFTYNLEQMFKDQELARDEMVSYKQHLSNTSKTTMDLQVSVLSAAAWPSYPDVKVNLPAEVARHIDKYDRHYKAKHTGRRLTWKHALAHSVVKAHFNKGQKELLVSSFQAIVLVLFNDIGPSEPLSYEAIASATGLVDVELLRTLQSLACAKSRVLNKHPKGRDVNPTDTFTVNSTFSDPKFRIKINQIQLKETKEENRETHERVNQDRQYETQAAIVRIMKSRKTMTHPQLVTEVIQQTKGRGAVELGEIKKNIEKLIEKDYIEREGGSYVYLA